jgi:Ser-tRNA(Ala) deacylase AlaX
MLLPPSFVVSFCNRMSEAEKEWVDVEREREVQRKEAERARQELETRKRIEARLLAKKEAESKARRESTENGMEGKWRSGTRIVRKEEGREIERDCEERRG